MRLNYLFAILLMSISLSAMAADDEQARYIDVTGTAQVEVVPDKIHYIVQLREFYAEEFEGKKPEEFRSYVSMQQIDEQFRKVLADVGIASADIRAMEIGNNWRREGEHFYVSKRYDITLRDFALIEAISLTIDRRCVEQMYIGELECDNIDKHRRQCRINALLAARQKASYMAQALDAEIGDVLQIHEPEVGGFSETAQSALTANVVHNQTNNYTDYRTLQLGAKVRVRFSLK